MSLLGDTNKLCTFALGHGCIILSYLIGELGKWLICSAALSSPARPNPFPKIYCTGILVVWWRLWAKSTR